MAADVRPSVLRFTVWLTGFNTWVLFEETIVDRYGLWQWMPYYRVARLCAWDVGAMPSSASSSGDSSAGVPASNRSRFSPDRRPESHARVIEPHGRSFASASAPRAYSAASAYRHV